MAPPIRDAEGTYFTSFTFSPENEPTELRPPSFTQQACQRALKLTDRLNEFQLPVLQIVSEVLFSQTGIELVPRG